MSKLRTDRRYSALCDYRWHRRCGWTSRHAWLLVLARYGW